MQLDSPLREAGLPQLINAVKSRMRQVAWKRLAPFELSPQQFSALMAVAEQEGLCHGELAKRTWMDKPTASRVIHALEARKLVRVAADPEHGKRLLLYLEAGTEGLIRQLRGFRMEVRDELEKGLGESERAQLRSILAKVMANLDRMEEFPPAPGPRRGRT